MRREPARAAGAAGHQRAERGGPLVRLLEKYPVKQGVRLLLFSYKT